MASKEFIPEQMKKEMGVTKKQSSRYCRFKK
jgi:hypothetical protein